MTNHANLKWLVLMVAFGIVIAFAGLHVISFAAEPEGDVYISVTSADSEEDVTDNN